ncbi:hypothetical protein P7C70_g6984, partial [Phenoliferia sp. Uapishka_3]
MPSSDSESPNSHNDKGVGGSNSGGGQSQLPRRGAKACKTCRKGKNRCINEGGEPPCKRCAQNGLQCVFEVSSGKTVDEEYALFVSVLCLLVRERLLTTSTPGRRVERLERTMSSLASTVEGLSGLIRSSGLINNNNNNNTFAGVNLSSLHHPQASASASPPVLQQRRHNQQPQPPQPVRLDADFNARSPSDMLHWDHQIMPSDTSLLPPHLAGVQSSNPFQNHQHHRDDLRPPTIPPFPTASVSFAIPSPGSGSSAHSPGIVGSLKRPRAPSSSAESVQREFPPLPNYRAPPHPISQYGLVPSAGPSDDEDDSLPTASLTAPFEALAEAAAAAAAGSADQPGSGDMTPKKNKRRRRRMPPPPNAFPDVVEKGLVDDTLARQIFSFYFNHCHRFLPILDPLEDTYENMRMRSPWAIDSILATGGGRMPDPSADVQLAAEFALEEAQGIARSSLFGPTVRKEGVVAMALLAAFSTEGYMATGHALRMSYDLGLHRALGKIAEGAEKGKVRREDEEKDLLVSCRIFLGLYWLDFVLSTGSGRPHLCDDELVAPDQMAALLRCERLSLFKWITPLIWRFITDILSQYLPTSH